MKKKHLVLLLSFLLQITLAAGQSYVINSNEIDSLSSSEFPIYIVDTSEHFDIQKITKQNLNNLFTSSFKRSS
jgi:hypothetical protein